MKDEAKLRKSVIEAGKKAVKELVSIAEKKILNKDYNDEEGLTQLTDDKLKNAAATKKLCILDAFEIIERINVEEERLRQMQEGGTGDRNLDNFAASRAK